MTAAPIFWFTGLSGAGKTTIATGTTTLLERDGIKVDVLDGDAVRNSIHRSLGFSDADIRMNNEQIAELCRQRRQEVDVVLVPIISPFAEVRRAVRERIGPGFFEVYVKASVDAVVRRDPKGLYAKADHGEIVNMIGYSRGTRYDVPANPDIELDTLSFGADELRDQLKQFICACLTNTGSEAPCRDAKGRRRGQNSAMGG